MTAASRGSLTLVLLWHMHQPEYRDYESGEFCMPWVYLHALKDYADMAWHLENHPGVRAVVNFSPVLLDQLEDYADQFATGRLRDPLLRLLARPAHEAIGEAGRSLILQRAFAPEHAGMGQPFPAFESLRAMFEASKAHGSSATHHLADQYFDDLLVWHHLCWSGETVRRASPVFTRLMAIGTRFSHTERRALLDLVGEVVRGIVPRYAGLAAAGRIEISTTPHHHPLAPLLISFQSSREALPALVLPQCSGYPGGYGRVKAQLEAAIGAHSRRFGQPPAGIWPAEGAISAPFLDLIGGAGCAWTASSGQVLLKSGEHEIHRPCAYPAGEHALAVFFRDDRLSDLIGFEYARWNSHDAAANLVAALEAIAATDGERSPVVSIMLDGENCWEHYAYNGYYFLNALYGALESHPGIRTATCSGCLASLARPLPALNGVVSGSWVHGDFSTWIGAAEKNHAWDLLCSAKQAFDVVVASGRLSGGQRAAAFRVLGACEGSDAFWWLGSGNAPPATLAEFDRLFRSHLAQLYRLLELPAPETLARALTQRIAHADAAPAGEGAMRRSFAA